RRPGGLFGLAGRECEAGKKCSGDRAELDHGVTLHRVRASRAPEGVLSIVVMGRQAWRTEKSAGEFALILRSCSVHRCTQKAQRVFGGTSPDRRPAFRAVVQFAVVNVSEGGAPACDGDVDKTLLAISAGACIAGDRC